ncbi:MAG: hypothetical protein ABI720_08445 [Actinomycetes bacterium]
MAESTDQELQAARAEIAKLRDENAQLRSAGGASGIDPVVPEPRSFSWVRSTAVVVLMGLGFVLVPTAGVAVWTRNTLLNTDRYVETVAPLADSPAVIDDVANAVTDEIFAQIDVETLLQENLPPELSFAAGPISSQVESTTKGLVVKALESDRFDVLWREINRQASASVVGVVTGKDTSEILQIENGELFLELQPVIDDVKTRLSDEGLTLADKLPAVSASVPLPVANVSYIQDAQTAVRGLNTLANVLPWVAALCFLGAVLLSRNRRRALVWTGGLISGAALLVGLSLAVGRGIYLDSVTSDLVSTETAAVVFDTVVRFLRNGVRVFFFLGIVLAFGAAVTGPAAWARKTREVSGGLMTQGGQRTGWNTGPFGAFVAAHRIGIQLTAAVVFGGAIFLVSQPTPSTVLWFVVALLVVVAAVQFLAATAPRQEEERQVEEREQVSA